MVANSAILIAIIMNYTKVTNPIDLDLTLSYLGESFYLSAKASDKFTSPVAEHWKFIYEFVELSPAEEAKVVKKIEETDVIKTKKK